jgi:hypothetical protein
MIQWLRRLFGKPPEFSNEIRKEPSDQAVLIHILAEDVQTDDPVSDLATLEDELQELLQGTGEVDGHDIGSNDATVFIYGSSAEAIFAIILPHLATGKLTERAKVTLRFGPPDSPERVAQLPDDR